MTNSQIISVQSHNLDNLRQKKEKLIRLQLTGVSVERRGRATGRLSASGAKAKEVLNVRGEQILPGSVRVVQKDGVNDERQQPLTALHPRLETVGGKIRDFRSSQGIISINTYITSTNIYTLK